MKYTGVRIVRQAGQSAGPGSLSPVAGLWCCSLCTPCRAQLAHLLPLLHRLLLLLCCQKQAVWVGPLSALHSALSQINPPDSFTTLLITYAPVMPSWQKKMWQGPDEFRLQQEPQLPDRVEFVYSLLIYFLKFTLAVSFFKTHSN